MRRTVLFVALACLLTLGGQSFAELCTIDAVPAATLLLPYFEVGLQPTDPDLDVGETADVDSGTNVDTLFSINNASAAPTIAHVTFWGDWSQPTIDFDVFLTGYDVATVSLANVFNNGNLPQTLHAWRDFETPPNISADIGTSPHQGPNSYNPNWDSEQPDDPPDPADITRDGCNVRQDNPAADDYCPRFEACHSPFAQLPLPTLQGSFMDLIRQGHTGRALPGTTDDCVGQVGGAWGEDQDNIARGYITIDNLNNCSIQFPNTPGYFDNTGSGSDMVIPLVKTQNQLWGDWYIIDQGRAIGDNLVAIEAWNDIQYPDELDGDGFDVGQYTFYGRYVDAGADDQREPLGSVWGARYLQPNPAFQGGTDLLVWRDGKCNREDPHSCDDGPLWRNLEETQVVDFSESEDAVELCGFVGGSAQSGGVSPVPPGTDPNQLQCFPIETGRYAVGDNNLNVQHDFGWLYLNLNYTQNLSAIPGAILAGPDEELGTADDILYCTVLDGLFGEIAQSYVVASVDNSDADNFYNVGLPAIQLASACDTGVAGNPYAGDIDGDGDWTDDSDIGDTPEP